MKKQETTRPRESPAQPHRAETSSEASQSFREAMEEFLRGRTDFKKRGRRISAVLPQGSPTGDDPGREEDAS